MKRIAYLLFLPIILLAACNTTPPTEPEDLPDFLNPNITSQMKVFVGNVELTTDQTITITDAEESLSGDMQMGIAGKITGASAFRVTIKRSITDTQDEFCAGQCMIGDGELIQDMDFTLIGGASETSWYAHFTPTEDGNTTISYTFQNYNKSLTLTVIYDYQSTK